MIVVTATTDITANWGIHLTGVRGVNWGDGSPARQREVLSGAELAVAHDPVRYQGPHRQPSTSKSPANAAAGASAPAEPGASFSESPVENNGVGQLRLNGYPRQPR